MADKTIFLLIQAKELLTENTWLRNGNYAADCNEEIVCFDSPRAKKFCAVGAILAAAHRNNVPRSTVDKAEWALYHANGDGTSVAYFNDSIATSVVDIHALYDRAIKELSSCH